MWLRRAVPLVFDPPSRYAGGARQHADLHGYLSDLVRPYGLALRDGAGYRAAAHSYGEMAEALLRAAVPAQEPLGLLVLAFAVPDLRPGRATATYLSLVCPGNPLAFALCDQGPTAAYTGLRLVRDFAGTGRRAALLVVEQSALPYEPASPVALPARHAGVALVCGPDGAAWLDAVRQHAGVAPGEAAALLRAVVAELSAGSADVTVVLGGGLPAPAGCRTVSAAPDQPDTGPWCGLAAELAGPPTAADRRVLVATYDPLLRYLSVLAATLPGAGGR